MADNVNLLIKSTFDATGAAAAKVAVGQVGDAATKADKQLLAYARSVAAAQKAQGDNAGAAQTLAGALGKVDKGSKDAQAAIATLARSTSGGASYAQQLGAAFRSSLLGIVGPAAVAAAAVGAVRGAFQAGGDALALRETENSLRLVAGSTQVYNTILQEAQHQQLLFGGSLQENIEGIQTLAVVSRSSGASLTTLIDLQKRLATLDPEQGSRGALVALNEALSGNVSSLSRRFEIPKDQLKILSDTALPVAERLQAVDAFLNKVGITSAGVEARVDKDAQTFRLLAQEADAARIALGNYLATAAAAVIRPVVDPGGQGRDEREQAGELAKKAENYKQYLATVQAANDQVQVIDPLSGATSSTPVTALTEAQFDYSRALQATGTSADEATQKAFALNDADAKRAQGLLELNALDGRHEAIMANAAGRTDTLIRASLQLGGAMDEERQKAAGLQVATGLAATDIQRSAEASALDAAQKDLQQQKTALVADETKRTVSEFLKLNPNLDATAAAAAAAAQGYSPLIQQLIAIQIEADKARAAKAALDGTSDARAKIQSAEGAFRLNEQGAGFQTQAQLSAGIELQRQRDQAEKDRLARTGTTAQKLAQAQKDAADAARVYGKDSTQAYNAQTAVIELQQQAAAEALRGAKSHTSELDKQLKLNEANYDSLNKQRDAALSLAEAEIKNRQESRDEDKKLATAEKILKSSTASDDFKARARDAEDLINVQRQQRLARIDELSATAGGTIRKGKLYQSLPGDGSVPAVPAAGGGGGAGSPVAAPAVAQAAGGVTVINQLVVDGKVAATAISPYLYDQLVQAMRGVLAQAGH